MKIGALTIVVVVVLGVAACGPTELALPQTESSVPAVVETEDVDFDAVITSTKAQVIASPYTARVSRVYVQEGARVRAGDKLFTLEDGELELKLDEVKAQERAMRAEAGALSAVVRAAAAKLRAQERLVQFGAASKMSVTEAETELRRAQGQAAATTSRVQAIQAERAQIERMLAQTTLTAPFDGLVLALTVNEGEVARQHETLARVFSPHDLVVKFAVPNPRLDDGVLLSTDQAGIAVGQVVELRTARPARMVRATVKRLSRQEPPINFTVVEAEIDDRDLTPDLHVASAGRVRIADARGARQ